MCLCGSSRRVDFVFTATTRECLASVEGRVQQTRGCTVTAGSPCLQCLCFLGGGLQHWPCETTQGGSFESELRFNPVSGIRPGSTKSAMRSRLETCGCCWGTMGQETDEDHLFFYIVINFNSDNSLNRL